MESFGTGGRIVGYYQTRGSLICFVHVDKVLNNDMTVLEGDYRDLVDGV